MVKWLEMKIAPRDGTTILACRDNGCGWDYMVVFWSTIDKDYPWSCGFEDGYSEDRLDYWMPLPEPPYNEDDSWRSIL